MLRRPDVESRVREAVLLTSERKTRIQPSHRFITDLGYDSLRIVALSLALEESFGRPLLLNDWLSTGSDVTRLTVGSLCDYVYTVISLDG